MNLTSIRSLKEAILGEANVSALVHAHDTASGARALEKKLAPLYAKMITALNSGTEEEYEAARMAVVNASKLNGGGHDGWAKLTQAGDAADKLNIPPHRRAKEFRKFV